MEIRAPPCSRVDVDVDTMENIRRESVSAERKKKGRDGAGREVGERNILRFWYADEDDKESAVAAKVVAATFYHEQCAGWSLF